MVTIRREHLSGLHVWGQQVFVGSGNVVGYVDFSRAKPTFEVLREEVFTTKAYDLFAHSGRYVLAIDDVSWPIWGDL